MTSFEYAARLRDLANWLETRPEFETETKVYMFLHYYDKEAFVAAVRAVGGGTKEFTEYDIQYTPKTGLDDGIFVRVDAPRNKVCRLVQEAVWDCEALLEPEELEVL